MFLANVCPEQALMLAERLRNSIANSYVELDNGQRLSVTISIGVCMLDGQALPECLVQATRPCMQPRRQGATGW